MLYGAIAQLARAFAWHARGRGFKSHWLHIAGGGVGCFSRYIPSIKTAIPPISTFSMRLMVLKGTEIRLPKQAQCKADFFQRLRPTPTAPIPIKIAVLYKVAAPAISIR